MARLTPGILIGAAVVATLLGTPNAVAQRPEPADSAAGAQKLQSLAIREWDVPWPNTRPRDPYAVSATEVWFVGQQGDYVASLNPETGEFRRVDLDKGAGPHNVIGTADGEIWYAGNRAAHLGKVDVQTGQIEKIAMPDPAARDPHTLITDAAGDLWFTVQGGNFIGKLSRRTHEVKLIAVPTAGARPYGIEIGEDGIVWSVLFGTNKLASVDPKTLALTELALPRAEARPRRIGITDDGRIWYVDYAGGMLGAFDPATGTFQEWPSPSGARSRPYGMAIDAENRVWFVETGVQPNRFVGFDPESESFFAASDVPSGGGTVRHMHYHGPTNTIWFGADTNTIGRVALD